MKSIILLALVACAYSAKLDRTYLPPNHAQTSGGSGSFLQAPFSGPSDFSVNGNGDGFSQNGNSYAQSGNYPQNAHARSYENDVNGYGNDFVNQPERAQAAFERNAAIVRLENDNDGETYSYAYETENGITAEENGVATNGVEAQGGYSYTGDDGQVYSVRYTAGQNGFLPEGEHLPTAPPVPEEILRALEQNARDEAAGIYDDGSYDDGKDNGADSGYNYNANNAAFANYGNNGNINNNAPSFNNDDEDTVVTNALRYTMADATQIPAFGSQANIPQSSRSQGNPSPRNFNGVNKAYLPPFANQGPGSRTSNGRTGFGSRSRKPSFSPRTGYQY